MAAAAPKPEDRLAFADELAQVRAKDVDGEYKKELDELEVEYQFILLRSLTLFHKEMRSGSLPDEIFERIEEYLPKRISTPFVAYKILSNVVQSAEEKYVLNYFWLQVPQNAVAKHICKWNDMLRQFDA